MCLFRLLIFAAEKTDVPSALQKLFSVPVTMPLVSFLLVNRTDFQYTYKICPMFLILIQLLSAARASII